MAEPSHDAGANPGDYGEVEAPVEDGPLVCERSNFDALESFYVAGEGNEVFLEKIAEIKRRYVATRCVRGDGNCFYRAIMFCLFERCIGVPEEARKLAAKLETFYSEGICGNGEGCLGYETVAIEMFYCECKEVLEPLLKEGVDVEIERARLLEAFCDYAKSNGIVVFARLICSCYMQQNEMLYSAFLEFEGLTVREFALREVEPLGKEVEQLQIVATTQALDAPLRVVYLDRSSGGLNEHLLPEDDPPPGVSRLDILYRPGHYDILYPAPPAP